MTYWHYTFIKSAKFNGELNFGWGVRSSETEFPDFAGIHEDFPDLVILSVNEIDEELYMRLHSGEGKREYTVNNILTWKRKEKR